MGQDNDIIKWIFGGLFMVRGVSPDGEKWLKKNLTDECMQYGKSTYCIPLRLSEGVIKSAIEAGLNVR